MPLSRKLRFESLETRQLLAVDFLDIVDQSVLLSSPLHVPIDVSNSDTAPVQITVTSSDPSVIKAELISNPKSLRLDVDQFGSMVFRLFPDEAPRPVARIEQLVQSGFYDRSANQQIIFHRVIDQFVIQAGDPTGTGTSGSTLGPFDDQFDIDLQHNRSGVLSYAKSQDDTNDSQFFITDVPLRHLDSNHSIFGQLIEGDGVRQAISQTPVDGNNRPLNDVVIERASIFDDFQNGLIRLSAMQNSGTATITIRVQNALGESTTKTFVAQAESDPFNSGPFLKDIVVPAIAPGSTIQLQLSSQDVEGDEVFYDSARLGSIAFEHSLNSATGLLTVTAPANVTSGVLDLLVGVRARFGSSTQDTFDVQRLRFAIHHPPVANNDLATATFERPKTIDILANDTSSDGSLVANSVRIVTPPSTGTARVLANGQIEFTHSLSSPQEVTFQYEVASEFGLFSQPATVTIAIRSIHQNPTLSLDVNIDQRVDPLDVLMLINNINALGSLRLPLDRSPNEELYLDPDGDGFLSPLDVLAVTNSINSPPLGGGEGESDEPIAPLRHATDLYFAEELDPIAKLRLLRADGRKSTG
jgi:cyclophilin family peptidyl-prolyl cis-trans isomerase